MDEKELSEEYDTTAQRNCDEELPVMVANIPEDLTELLPEDRMLLYSTLLTIIRHQEER